MTNLGRDNRTAFAPKIASPCMRGHGKHITVRHGFPCDGLPGIDSAATDSQGQAMPRRQGATSPNSGFRGFEREAHGVREVGRTGRCPNERERGSDRRPDSAAQAAKGRPQARGAPGPARGFGPAFGFCRFAMKGGGPCSAVRPGFRADGAGGRGSPFCRSERTGPPGRSSPAGRIAPRSRA